MGTPWEARPDHAHFPWRSSPGLFPAAVLARTRARSRPLRLRGVTTPLAPGSRRRPAEFVWQPPREPERGSFLPREKGGSAGLGGVGASVGGHLPS